MSYEFSKQEEDILNSFAVKTGIIGVLFMISSILLLVGVLTTEMGRTDQVLRTLIALIQIAVGGLFVYPSMNFRRVKLTEGSDVQELMEGIHKLKTSMWALLYLMLGLMVVSGWLILSP